MCEYQLGQHTQEHKIQDGGKLCVQSRRAMPTGRV